MNESVIHLRAVTEADLPFLQQVYASTRAEELAMTDWDAAQKSSFVAMQFEAQHRYYAENYAGAEWRVIEVDAQPAGRLYLHPRADELRIMEITLLPEFRGRGVGNRLLADVLARGQSSGRRVTIHVERFNPALRLYERLGFRLIEDKGVYLFLGWNPATRAVSAAQEQEIGMSR